ncbi:MAG: recombinase family protein [Chloroflexota bacterium]
MKIGYARVSTQDQDVALQIDALEAAGCERIYQEKRSSGAAQRPQLNALLGELRSDDIVIVWKLDRLARSLSDLVNLVNAIQSAGASLHSLQDHIDTSTAGGKFTFHIFAALAEFERDIIRERTKAGLAAARARGRVGGRPKGLSKSAQQKAEIAEHLYRAGKLSIREICEHVGVAKSTLYKYLAHQGVEVGSRNPIDR